MHHEHPSVRMIMAAAIEGPCAVTFRDPRDGRPAYLTLVATAEGYAARLDTGYLDDGTSSLVEHATIETAAGDIARHVARLLKQGYRPLRLEGGSERAA